MLNFRTSGSKVRINRSLRLRLSLSSVTEALKSWFKENRVVIFKKFNISSAKEYAKLYPKNRIYLISQCANDDLLTPLVSKQIDLKNYKVK